MFRSTLIAICFLLFFACNQTRTPLPACFTDGVSNPVMDLNGTWKVNVHSPEAPWEHGTTSEGWEDIRVPGECMMQGFSIRHDQPFYYKRTLDIPADYAGKRVVLQFDGVYSFARVWINGQFIREHFGGFTRWDCDISSYVQPGERAELTVEVTDRADDISYGSGYAKHQIGGILRDVRLLALPVHYPGDVTIQTDLDDHYQHADLIVSGTFTDPPEKGKITLQLFDEENRRVPLKNASVTVSGRAGFRIMNHIDNPHKWDAEHPVLYNVSISYAEKGKLLWHKMYQAGFREITVVGNRLHVNGKEVKLRGACRHDMHPLLGRVSTPEYELKDVLLAKEANMNFIRTSHYPPTDHFLQLCDQYGIYVEDETAVCFVGTHRTEDYRPGNTENDPRFESRYLSQLEEMVTTHKNHPSVIMWSIGNENSFGTNFMASYTWVKAHDGTRPVIFSYPGNVPDSIHAYDILSMHYPDLTGHMNQHGKVTEAFGYKAMPVIFDEWAHVACYDNFTVMEDPNIRDFWGMGLDSMWQKTFDSDGGLGGAIWGMIDETFMLPDTLPGFNKWWGKIDELVIPAAYSGHTVGYGEWGILDTWRRKKPEFWNVKKAYSPVKLLQTEVADHAPGEPLSIPVYNRFDHTNINELIIKSIYRNQEKELKVPDIEPHQKGVLIIPVNEWDPGEPLFLEFLDRQNRLIDKYTLRLHPDNKLNEENERLKKDEPAEVIRVEENQREIHVLCEHDTRIIFSKKSGLITAIEQPSGRHLFSGPHINLRTKGKPILYTYYQIDDHCQQWQLKSFRYRQSGNELSIRTRGIYDNHIPVEYRVSVTPSGKIAIRYQIENLPREYIRELGISFKLEDVYDSLSWEREPYWSYYPAAHLSSRDGTVALYAGKSKRYRNRPGKEWNADNKSFYYNGTADEAVREQFTNRTRSSKEHIIRYGLLRKGIEEIAVRGTGLKEGKGNISCRIARTGNGMTLYANNEMDYVDLGWGNFQRNIILNQDYTNEILLQINTR